MLNLKKIVIHLIKKETAKKDSANNDAELTFSKRCLDSSEGIRINLVSKLSEAFSGKNSRYDYSSFDKNEPFPQILNEYLSKSTDEEDLTDNDFLDFSKKAVRQLFEIIEKKPPAKGGYLVFTEYHIQQQHFISIFLVRDIQGNLFQIHGDVVDVENLIVTDTDKLAMACRISPVKFLGGDELPLMMINKRSPEVSDYFANWLGSKDRETSEKFTNILHDVIRKIKPPTDADGKQLSVDNVRQKVFEVINADSEGNVNLSVIGKVAFKDEDAIHDFIKENNIDLPSDFTIYRPSLRNFVEYRVEDHDLKLQFPRGDFKRKIKFGQNNTVIIKSATIYNELKAEFGKDEV